VLDAIHMLLAAEVLLVFGLSQPSPLARSLARRSTLGLGTVFLPVAQAGIAAKQLLATQASTSSGLHHGASGPLGTESCPEELRQQTSRELTR